MCVSKQKSELVIDSNEELEQINGGNANTNIIAYIVTAEVSPRGRAASIGENTQMSRNSDEAVITIAESVVISQLEIFLLSIIGTVSTLTFIQIVAFRTHRCAHTLFVCHRPVAAPELV